MNMLESFIGNVAFPIVAFLLMYKLSVKTIASNTNAIEKLTKRIEALCQQVNKG